MASFQHAGQDQLREMERRLNLNSKHQIEMLLRKIHYLSKVGHCSIVDQNVNRTNTTLNGFNQFTSMIL